MPITVSLYKKLEEVEPQLRSVLFAILEEIERQREETVTKNEFNELKEIVRDLASAQRVTEKKVSELAIAQKETEKQIRELILAQKETDKKVRELTLAQKETDKKVGELADAQKNTEIALRELAIAIQQTRKDLKATQKEVGGLSNTIGYTLENEAYKFLPELLKKEYGFVVKDSIVRKYVKDNKNNEIEVNILGRASRNGKKYVIVGEAKAQLSRRKVLEFIRKKLNRLEGVFEDELFPILITHMISAPDVEEYAKKQGVKRVYYSYDFK